jgi:hypothetical protein
MIPSKAGEVPIPVEDNVSRWEVNE